MLYSLYFSSFVILTLAEYNFPAYTFNPTSWPSVGPSTDGFGYCTAPVADASMTAQYPLPTDSSISVAPHPAATIQACPQKLDPSWDYTGSCWWTCGANANGGNCLRSTDIVSCSGPNTIGLSFDDGPESSTLALLDYLVANNLKATFFLVGSNLVQNPQVARKLFQAGMELGVHTWSHHALTSQTNDVVIAELGFTIKAFQAVLGFTPTLFRPPLGDIDDRVRSIAKSMGLTPVLWLADTEDYTTDGHPELTSKVVKKFKNLFASKNAFPNGTVVLEHDYFQGGVNLAIKQFIPFFKSKGYAMQSVGQCHGLSADGWYSSNSNSSNSNSSNSNSSDPSNTRPGLKNHMGANNSNQHVSFHFEQLFMILITFIFLC